MKDKLLSFVVLPSIMFALFLAFSPVGGVNAKVEEVHKIKLCHATSAVSNPYGPKTEEIDDDAILTSGHDGHNGPVWNSTMTNDDDWGDIIPPFPYGDGQSYPGKNWTTEGQAIWNNNCQPVVEPIRSDFNLTSMCKPSATEGSLRVRNQSDLDYPYVLKLYKTSTEFSGTAPANTDTLVTVPWTASNNTWILEIAGFSFTKAIGNNALCEPQYEKCSVTTTSYGDWSQWEIDNENESKLVRIRPITYYDSVETEYVCDTGTGKESMDRPLCQYEGATYADEELCVPEDDEPEVLGEDDETGVVLAATGPTDNILVYVVELLLVAMLVTYSVFFTKTYLKNSK